MGLVNEVRANRKKQQWLSESIHVGYYFVVVHTGKRHFFGTTY